MKKIADQLVFIVDDDCFCRELYKTSLINMGFTNINLYSNGNDCIDNLHMQPDMIFLDYNMAPINGVDTLKKVKQANKSINVLLLSSCKDATVINSAMNSGAMDYIFKNDHTIDSLKSSISTKMNYNF